MPWWPYRPLSLTHPQFGTSSALPFSSPFPSRHATWLKAKFHLNFSICRELRIDFGFLFGVSSSWHAGSDGLAGSNRVSHRDANQPAPGHEQIIQQLARILSLFFVNTQSDSAQF